MKRAAIQAIAVGMISTVCSGYATADQAQGDGPFTANGFVRQKPMPGVQTFKAATAIPVEDNRPIIFDEQGNSNQLIVRFNYDNPGHVMDPALLNAKESKGDFERKLLQSVANGDATTRYLLLGASHARHLISGNRLSAKQRDAYGPDHPRERLEQFIVLTYPTVTDAQQAAEALKRNPGVSWVSINQRSQVKLSSWVPNDKYFSRSPTVVGPSQPPVGTYQWGMHVMSFPAAWDITTGNAYIGTVDTGLLQGNPPDDLIQNYRTQFSHTTTGWPAAEQGVNAFHGTHVLGIIGATANNNIGVSGGCPTCSIATVQTAENGGMTFDAIAAGIQRLADSGIQVVNMSFNAQGNTNDCSSEPNTWGGCGPATTALEVLSKRDILAVGSSGNFSQVSPEWPASIPSVLAVAGAQNDNPAAPSSWSIWTTDYKELTIGSNVGSSAAGTNGVIAPAKDVVSTVPASVVYLATGEYGSKYNCTDGNTDGSGVPGDGYGTCTGTSMAAPHVSALGGLLRSADPLMSASDIKSVIRNSGSNSLSPNQTIGYGMPNAQAALNSMFSGPLKNRLTPLFSFYSANRLDFLYTTVPQMATAAILGTLEPRSGASPVLFDYVPVGTQVTSYPAFPDTPSAVVGPSPQVAPAAESWIFTTPINPIDASMRLIPLYRMSWKCGDGGPALVAQPAICWTNPNHTDTVYTTEQAGIDAYGSFGYKLDGIEGYIYPKTMSQPADTKRLMRKYNPSRDDHAIFPENKLAAMTGQGYTENSYSDWLGYVYPNTTGVQPIITTSTTSPVTESVPTFRAASMLNGSGTLGYPAGTVSTDWLVMYVMGALNTVPTPAGWTLTSSYVWPSDYGYPVYVFSRQAGTGSGVPLTIPFGGAFMLAYQNASGIGATGQFAYSDYGTASLPSITPRSTNSVVLGIVSDRDSVNPVPPTGFSSRLNFTMTYFGNNVAEKKFGNTNPTGSVTWTQNAGSYGAAGALIEVLPGNSTTPSLLSPGISAAISPSSVQTGTSATMTITLSNPNSTAITGAAFTNIYPLNLVNAAPSAVTTTCTGAVSAAAGGTSVALTSGTIPASGSCTVTVAVKSAVAGTYTNTIAAGGLTTTNAGANASTASAALTVTAPPASTTSPTFRAASVLNGSGTLSYPAGTVSTDWLVMYVMGALNTVPTPTGWTLTSSYVWPSYYGYPIYVFSRQAGTGSGVPLTIPFGGALMLAYQNASGIGATGQFAYSDYGTASLPSITPQSANSVVLGIVSDRDPVNPVPPTGFSSRLNFTMTYFGNNVAEKKFGNTNPTGSLTWTQNAGSYGAAGALIELLPVK